MMKNYLQYIKEINELDPYGEEIWDEGVFNIKGELYKISNNPIRIGDYFVWNDKLEWGPHLAISMDDFIGKDEIPLVLIGPTGKKLEKIEENYILNEKLGISKVTYETAKLIYDIYNLHKYEGVNRDNCKDKISIDTSQLPSPYDEMTLTLKFKKTERPKHVHGGMDRINEKEFDLFIYQHCNNLPRTLTHELNHIYQVFLRGKHYKRKEGEPSALRKSEQSPTLMSIYTQLHQRGVSSQKDFIEKLQALPKYKKYVKILKDPEQSKRAKEVAIKMIKKMHKMYDLFTENVNSEKTLDIKINVENKNYLIEKLIDNLSLVVKKKKMKSIRIKGISGYINKEFFTRKGYLYETKLEITLSNKDVIFGEYKSINNEILIKVNEEIVYNINHKSFDNDVLIDKIVSEYIKCLKTNKYKVNEGLEEQLGDEWLEVDVKGFVNGFNHDLAKRVLRGILLNKEVNFCFFTIDPDGTINDGYDIQGEVEKVELKDKSLYLALKGQRGIYMVDLDEPVVVRAYPPKIKPEEKPIIRWYNKGKLEKDFDI